MALKNFDHKVAVITGGGSGIGQALAGQLAAKAGDLALVDVNRSGMQKTEKKLASHGIKLTLHIADVSKEN